MIRKLYMFWIGIAVCAFVLVAMAVPKEEVERPFKINGNITITIDLRTCVNMICTGMAADWGEATHVGRYSNRAQNLVVNLGTGFVGGSGVLTAANGDELFWERDNHEFVFANGTGRFENATGRFEITHPDAVIAFPDANTLVVTHPYEGEGTITY